MWTACLNSLSVIFVAILLQDITIAYAHEPCTEDEIFLELRVNNQLRFDLDGIICGENLYLPVSSFLTILKISHTYSTERKFLELMWPEHNHHIEFRFPEREVHVRRDEIILPESSMIYSGFLNEWLVEKEFLEKALDMSLDFRFNEMRLNLITDHPVPVITEYQRIQSYQSLLPSDIDLTPDTHYAAERHLLNGMTAGWSLNSTISEHHNTHSLGLALGGNLLGGDLLVSGRASNTYGINQEGLRAFWRYPFHNTQAITQLTAGITSHRNLYRRGNLQYTGVEITNRPLYPRYEFGNYQIAGELEPGWDVEFYSRNRLTDIVRTDSGTSYHFNETLHYGSNNIRLRYYSPRGFSHEETYHIQIPQSILPKGKFEYSVAAGRYQRSDEDFTRGEVLFGLTSFLTMGGGHQLTDNELSGITHTSFLLSSLRLGKRLMIEGNHTVDYLTEANFRLLYGNFRSVNLRYNRYHQHSPYHLSGARDEAVFNTSFPIRMGSFRPALSFNLRGTRFEQFERLSLNTRLSASILNGYYLQIRSRMIYRSYHFEDFNKIQNDYMFNVSKRLFRRYTLRPGLVYDYRFGQIRSWNVELRGRLSRNSYGTINFDRDELQGQNRFMFSFRVNFNSARYNSNVTVRDGGNYYINQSIRSTTFFDSNNGDLFFDTQQRFNNSMIRLVPYFVNSDNEVLEDDDLKGQELNATVYRRNSRYGARAEGNLIKNLIPYEEFIIKIDPESFDNPLWQSQAETFRVQTHPYGVNKLYVPIVVMGEAEGRVILPDEMNPNLARGLRITLRRTDGTFEESIMTYSGGRFYYVGLPPGEYTASVDAEQLSARSVTAVQEQIEFTIRATARGDIVDHLLFETILISE
jgi:hypothetical protein